MRELKKIIAKNIQSCLDENNINIKDYAEIINSSRQTTANYLRGKTPLNSVQLHITAKYFNKRMEWFFEEEHNSLMYSDEKIETIIKENQILTNTNKKIFDESVLLLGNIFRLIKKSKSDIETL